ncbi:hypothetical protein Cob_v005540 [Colletotrichum orbiculare MAFF 240422]|uniref:Uncharacterized protein n=1 Tax=Colletotrichum orbiculare (strain 104-T / ATCC 96160 / CBS 514.97 / LARS 414 / MAFF 240422) TaxID=1213857 RepID=N4V767_COLOR|nr:hypothetical protein Cob_v005540 [Colletotrichum orbiculare MAFF 240422]
MNTKALLALLFASMVAAVPAVSENEGALLNTRQRTPVPPSARSCCSNIPGTCDCGCCPGGPCATFEDPRATCP